MHCDVGNTWFVVMQSEADAVSTMLRIQKKEITYEASPSIQRLPLTSVQAF